jgi:hypothetical protein
VLARIREEISIRVLRMEKSPGGLQEMVAKLENRELDLYEAALELLRKVNH